MSALTVFDGLVQGSDEWLSARAGVVTASVVGQLLTSRGAVADNQTSRSLVSRLAGERITGRPTDTVTTRAMERGHLDEPYAREAYAHHYAPVTETGFMLADHGAYSLGYSPDGLVGDDGLIEIKSRSPHVHLATVLSGEVPAANMAQLQAGLMVSGRAWVDYVSYCAGMRLWVKRVEPDPAWQDAITKAVTKAEESIQATIWHYESVTDGMPDTEYVDHYQETEITI